jgi:hypothetical protein
MKMMLTTLGAIIAAMVLWAAPVSFDWSLKQGLSLSWDRAQARHRHHRHGYRHHLYGYRHHRHGRIASVNDGTPEMTEKPIISFRIRADIKDALEKLAEQDRRSLSQYIENALEDHVADKQQEGKIQR